MHAALSERVSTIESSHVVLDPDDPVVVAMGKAFDEQANQVFELADTLRCNADILSLRCNGFDVNVAVLFSRLPADSVVENLIQSAKSLAEHEQLLTEIVDAHNLLESRIFPARAGLQQLPDSSAPQIIELNFRIFALEKELPRLNKRLIRLRPHQKLTSLA
jgi:hypothetical protein